MVRMDDETLSVELQERGFAVLPRLLRPSDCEQAAAWFDQDRLFRSTVHMERFRFGRGTYRYFAYPLPDRVLKLRAEFYRRLVPIANRWAESLKVDRYPKEHEDFIAQCRRAGQDKPTPLLQRYEAGDYNCLHQDLYGPCAFPLQLVCLLSEPGRDYQGGELVLTEQRPRAQTRAHVVPLCQGDAAIIASHHFPRRGTRGMYRATLRHGVGEIRHGRRFTLGIVFHDAA
jgi:hypothetical protein